MTGWLSEIKETIADTKVAPSQFQNSELPIAGKVVFRLLPLPPIEADSPADWFPGKS